MMAGAIFRKPAPDRVRALTTLPWGRQGGEGGDEDEGGDPMFCIEINGEKILRQNIK